MCVRLFHPWPQRQAEMFFTGRSASCCLHGLPQHCDAFPVLKWAHHLLAALEWGEITLKGSDHLLFVLCTCLYKLWGAEESVLYSVLISSSIKQWSRPCRLLTSSRLETLYNKMILLWQFSVMSFPLFFQKFSFSPSVYLLSSKEWLWCGMHFLTLIMWSYTRTYHKNLEPETERTAQILHLNLVFSHTWENCYIFYETAS